MTDVHHRSTYNSYTYDKPRHGEFAPECEHSESSQSATPISDVSSEELHMTKETESKQHEKDNKMPHASSVFSNSRPRSVSSTSRVIDNIETETETKRDTTTTHKEVFEASDQEIHDRETKPTIQFNVNVNGNLKPQSNKKVKVSFTEDTEEAIDKPADSSGFFEEEKNAPQSQLIKYRKSFYLPKKQERESKGSSPEQVIKPRKSFYVSKKQQRDSKNAPQEEYIKHRKSFYVPKLQEPEFGRRRLQSRVAGGSAANALASTDGGLLSTKGPQRRKTMGVKFARKSTVRQYHVSSGKTSPNEIQVDTDRRDVSKSPGKMIRFRSFSRDHTEKPSVHVTFQESSDVLSRNSSRKSSTEKSKKFIREKSFSRRSRGPSMSADNLASRRTSTSSKSSRESVYGCLEGMYGSSDDEESPSSSFSNKRSFSEPFQYGDTLSMNSDQTQFFFDLNDISGDEDGYDDMNIFEEFNGYREAEFIAVRSLSMSSSSSTDCAPRTPRMMGMGSRNGSRNSKKTWTPFTTSRTIEKFEQIVDHTRADYPLDFPLVIEMVEGNMEFAVLPHNSVRMQLNDLHIVLESLNMMTKHGHEGLEKAVEFFYKWWDAFVNFITTFLKLEKEYLYPLVERKDELIGVYWRQNRCVFHKEAMSLIEDVNMSRVKSDGGFLAQLPYVSTYASKFSKSLVKYMKDKEKIIPHALQMATPAECLKVEKKMVQDLLIRDASGLNFMIYVREISDSDRFGPWAKERLTMMQRLRKGGWEKHFYSKHIKFVQEISKLVPDFSETE